MPRRVLVARPGHRRLGEQGVQRRHGDARITRVVLIEPTTPLLL